MLYCQHADIVWFSVFRERNQVTLLPGCVIRKICVKRRYKGYVCPPLGRKACRCWGACPIFLKASNISACSHCSSRYQRGLHAAQRPGAQLQVLTPMSTCSRRAPYPRVLQCAHAPGTRPQCIAHPLCTSATAPLQYEGHQSLVTAHALTHPECVSSRTKLASKPQSASVFPMSYHA